VIEFGDKTLHKGGANLLPQEGQIMDPQFRFVVLVAVHSYMTKPPPPVLPPMFPLLPVSSNHPSSEPKKRSKK
jgi:hypothetical protein